MKRLSQDTQHDKSSTRIIRQMELITKLLLIIATDKDFSAHTQEHQIAILGKLGFRNKELAETFGITRQQVNNALRKYKGKRL
jgi:DNA-binding CsgD family transcriptional regulator